MCDIKVYHVDALSFEKHRQNLRWVILSSLKGTILLQMACVSSEKICVDPSHTHTHTGATNLCQMDDVEVVVQP